ncbi:MAG: hypothetical protein A2934_00465 [Candidatus Sungbacteria bacterium RIFCSPLOWO2_01_FULL_47_10]|uniref:Methyltransferase type 11 domain-containing protein n=1 Tax=Candidatus Sungbacteria bacterium RIFCSPLOWO2_01_FULL_47_10 TaxID=1802276 RepID=A0A1G2L4D4_9BACT|nr:MAG: hypothetical protein A2934_00465 [Candidatus Sungbacteria bacterium RIFCSPLOWO2_01_FULL_47_10]
MSAQDSKKLNYDEIRESWEKRGQDDTVDIVKAKGDIFWDNYEKKVVSDVVNTGDRVLDVGCGTGRILEMIIKNGCEAYGIDYAKSCVMRCKTSYPKADVREGLAESLPYEDSFFDVVVAVRTLQSMPEKERKMNAFRDLVRVTKKNGHIVLIEGNAERLTGHPLYNYYLREDEWSEIFKNAGVKLVKTGAIPLATLLSQFDREYCNFEIRRRYPEIYEQIYTLDQKAALTGLKRISHEFSFVLTKS